MKKKRILLVEDDMPTVDVYSTALTLSGFEVEVITFGKKAIEEVEKIEKGERIPPDLIILDIILPDMNGLEILKKIREGKKTKDLDVLMLTNYIQEQVEKMGFGPASEKFMLKSNYSPTEIVKIVKKTIKEK